MEQIFLVDGPVTTGLISGHINALGKRDDTGGHSIFLGQVRGDIKDNKRVKAIEYSAYNEMVATQAKKFIDVTINAFSDVKHIVIIHSTGLVKVGEVSLLVLVAAGHRDQATRACRHILEMIKADYPVWKKEIFEDDSHLWREND